MQAKSLRKTMTDAERNLWYHLRAHRFYGLKFKRQYPIGPYIVDFVCIEHALIIELDGGQHAVQINYDAKRDNFLRQQGFTVLRFWNNDVLANMEGALTVIMQHVNPDALSPNPSPVKDGRGEHAQSVSTC